MYAFCKVKDPKTTLPKFVLINWVSIIWNFKHDFQNQLTINVDFIFKQGEGAPAIRKGTCANHLSAIQKFFKGIHITINARTEDDVEEESILEKVAKASGSAYNFNRQESKERESESNAVVNQNLSFL